MIQCTLTWDFSLRAQGVVTEDDIALLSLVWQWQSMHNHSTAHAVWGGDNFSDKPIGKMQKNVIIENINANEKNTTTTYWGEEKKTKDWEKI